MNGYLFVPVFEIDESCQVSFVAAMANTTSLMLPLVWGGLISS